jgi:hypothetical protein
MIGIDPTPTARFGVEVMLDVECQAGFLPAPTLRIDKLTSLTGDDRAKYFHAASYHTDYVMGLMLIA